MYDLAVVLFGGLVTAKSVDFVRHLIKDMNKATVLFLSALLGIGYAFLLDYSVFAGWNIAVRTEWLGTIGTGLFMAGLAGGWHEVLGVLREWAHRYHGEATEIESRMHRAA